MKKISATNNGINLQFTLRGICKFGGLNKKEILTKLRKEGTLNEDDSITTKMLKHKSFQAHPVENELILVSASFQMLGIKGDSVANQARYTLILERALGALVEYEGKKYIVSECPNEIGPHFCFQYAQLHHDGTFRGNMIVMDQKIIVGDTSHGFSIEKVDNKPNLLWFINDNHQTWYAYVDFVFCLKEK